MARPCTKAGMGLLIILATLAFAAQQAAAQVGAAAPVTPAALEFSCAQGCTFDVAPVCGADGEWYQNLCVMACAGEVAAADQAACSGKAMPFVDAHPGPRGAESASLNLTANVVPSAVFTRFLEEGFRYVGRIRLAHDFSPRPELPAANATAAAAPDGSGSGSGSGAAMPEPERDADGDWRVKAVRCTPEGDVYVGAMKIPAKLDFEVRSYIPPWLSRKAAGGNGNGAAARGNTTLASLAAAIGISPPASLLRAEAQWSGATADADGSDDADAADAADSDSGALAAQAPAPVPRAARGRLETLISDFFSLFTSSSSSFSAQQQQQQASSGSSDDDGSSSSGDAATAAAQQQQAQQAQRRLRLRRRGLLGRALKSVVGGDDRTNCERGFPYTAIGQIQVVDNTGLYICTGTLIAPDKVLTAGHCVWNIKRGAFYYNLNYAPGRYRDGGSVVNPWGVVPWKSVTVFDSFKKNPSVWDVAVVTLAKPLGSLTGYMGIAAGCARNLPLTTAGYPQDKSPGTCMASSCNERTLDCDAPTNPHTCDTIMGMSGSPLWDGKNRVRLIHVAGVEGRDENRATTLTQFLVNTVAKW